MPLAITPDRSAVRAVARALQLQHPQWAATEVADRALRDFYRLSPSDGIWGGSDAAMRMGYAGHAEHENLFAQIAGDLAAECQDRDRGPHPCAPTHPPRAPSGGHHGENDMHMQDWRVRVQREGRFEEIGQVSESSETLARCAALSRYGVTEDELDARGVRPRGAAIYPDEDFEVAPLG